jgi:predicted CXXCH cytochrome family protein
MTVIGKRTAAVLLVVAGSAALGSCVDEDVVFDDRPIYQQVVEEAGGFVGYADPSDGSKLTFCGACHTDLQAQWIETAHAGAWAGLQESDHAREFCEACHSVTSLGNTVAEPSPGEAVGGHVAVATEDGRYQDVQCESCHGPGLEHVQQPGAANVPLAPIRVGAELSSGCGECHQGFHHPFVEEWEISAHADVSVFAATNTEDGCYLCHSGEGALELFGVGSDYIEKQELEAAGHFAQITCAVCHDPHGSPYDGDLRFPVSTTDADAHLCAVCHDLRPRPDTELPQESIRTHAPSTGLIVGNAGWFPPGSGLGPGEIVHPHGQAEDLCASCHVVAQTGVDDAGTEFFAQGHTFLAAPCTDASGRPTGDQGCELTAAARDFTGCVECHASEEESAALLRSAVSDLLPRVRTLAARLAAIDPNGAAPGGEISSGDFRFTAADGAYFTLSVALSARGLSGFDPQDRRVLAASVTHNPTLLEALVEAALDALAAEYGVAGGAVPTAGWWDAPGH